MTTAQTPPLEAGLTYVEQPDAGALHRLVLRSDAGTAADESDGRASDGAARTSGRETLWIDAGGAASTYGLTAQAPTRRALRGIRVARAFTAHQHHQLVRNAVGEASGRTGLVVAPNVAALYDAADACDAEVDRLFRASLALLADLADALAVPVLVSAPRASEQRRATVRERADREIECERTDLGYAFATEGFETTGYWQRGWWQTTIPYWAELCGTVAERAEAFEPTAVAASLAD
ncbi:hypothetical protein [Halomicrobium salinisoli]|uniref:hypothetical protein n=1 Tax=Halomicrobium salinisoli TaxID=2878391 RepID=UPI001CF0644B|nr:hypothetical protein [Halomicrobium salinisoli]